MYEVNIPAKPFRVSPYSVTIPEYRNAEGNPFSCSALIYDGNPYLKVAELCIAISGGSPSCANNCQNAIKTIISRSRFGSGSIIVTKRGIFADPHACKSILAAFFGDSSSPDRNIISKRGNSRGRRPGVKQMRCARDSDLYEAIQLFANSRIGAFSAAQNQIHPLWLKKIDPSTLKVSRAGGITGRDIIDGVKSETVQQAVDEKIEVAAAKTEESAPAAETTVDKAPEKEAKDTNVEVSGKAGMDLISSLVTIGAQASANPLTELIRVLASGKSITVKVSID